MKREAQKTYTHEPILIEFLFGVDLESSRSGDIFCGKMAEMGGIFKDSPRLMQ